MRKVLLGCVAVTLCISLTAVAEDATSQNLRMPTSGTVTISGRLSEDGRTLVTSDSTWTVENPAAVKGREGRQVTVKCRVLPDKHAVDVLSLKLSAGQTRYAVNYGDAVFRR